MRHLAVITILATLFGVGMSVAPASAGVARAGGCIQVSRIYYNSPGSDTGSNSSLNAEWVQLRNSCSSGRSLSGWTLRDASSHVYRFGSYTLRAGYSVKIHTGRGTNTSTDRYWGSGWYIWNNTGDTAILRNSAGATVDSCRYPGTSTGWVYC